jgi:hypothetical protein
MSSFMCNVATFIKKNQKVQKGIKRSRISCRFWTIEKVDTLLMFVNLVLPITYLFLKRFQQIWNKHEILRFFCTFLIFWECGNGSCRSRTAAIEVHMSFEHAYFVYIVFPFPLRIGRIKGDFFGGGGGTRAVFKFLSCLSTFSIHAQTIRWGIIFTERAFYISPIFLVQAASPIQARWLGAPLQKRCTCSVRIAKKNSLNFCLFWVETEICACFKQKRHGQKKNIVDRNTTFTILLNPLVFHCLRHISTFYKLKAKLMSLTKLYWFPARDYLAMKKRKGRLFFFFWFFIQHCFICRPSACTMSEEDGIESRPIATLALAARRSNHSARSHTLSTRSHLPLG